jgi:pSer/pThr/pTyr-binding forkhead associated (FHA) protein
MSDQPTNQNEDRTSETFHEQKKHRLRSSGLLTSRAVLIVVSENYFGEAFVISEPEMVVGRSEKCGIRLKDKHISALHCTISVGEDCKYYIEDLDSTNSTFINRKELKKKVQLFYGDRIVIGKTIFRFLVEEKIEDE